MRSLLVSDGRCSHSNREMCDVSVEGGARRVGGTYEHKHTHTHRTRRRNASDSLNATEGCGDDTSDDAHARTDEPDGHVATGGSGDASSGWGGVGGSKRIATPMTRGQRGCNIANAAMVIEASSYPTHAREAHMRARPRVRARSKEHTSAECAHKDPLGSGAPEWARKEVGGECECTERCSCETDSTQSPFCSSVEDPCDQISQLIADALMDEFHASAGSGHPNAPAMNSAGLYATSGPGVCTGWAEKGGHMSEKGGHNEKAQPNGEARRKQADTRNSRHSSSSSTSTSSGQLVDACGASSPPKLLFPLSDNEADTPK